MVQPGHKVLSLAHILVASQYFLCYSHATLLNSTVDDAGPDPVTGATVVYSSNAGWNFNSTCGNCWVHLDTTQVYNHTWHDATYDRAHARVSRPQNATFQFTGTYSPQIMSAMFNYTLTVRLGSVCLRSDHRMPT